MATRTWLLSLAAIALAGALFPRAAQAYPQWQFSAGATRCNQCHFSPAGGGLITGYGRDKVGDELSMVEGDGSFAHGAVELPSWLALSLDTRFAFLMRDDAPEGPKRVFFPMQFDVLGRAALTDAISVQASVGVRGQIRSGQDPSDPGGPQPAGIAQRVISREHYLMWRPQATGPYVRAGRFYAPFGLRMVEHTLYNRRDLGFNLQQESYNISGGFVKDEWELHVTAFGPDFLQKLGANEVGGAAYFEKRLGDASSIALQTRLGFGDGFNRYATGTVGKIYFESLKLMLLGEANLVMEIAGSNPTQHRFVGLGGASFFPIKGIMLTALAQRSQTSLSVRDSATHAFNGFLSIFPYPHVEVAVMGQVEAPAGNTQTKMLLMQLHYFL